MSNRKFAELERAVTHLEKALIILRSQILDCKTGGDQPSIRLASGQLNAFGVAEIERRFEAGESDSTVALAMAISLSGVSKRRAFWRRSRKAA
jgi:hypothetical protein